MKLVKLLSVIIISLLTLYACQNSTTTTETENETEDRHIVTSIYPVEYIVSEIAGDYVNVETIVPSGADAHSYEPSTKTMIELSSSDGFFYIGEGMESFSETMAETVQNENVETLKLGGHVELFESFSDVEEIDVDSEEHEGHDHEDEDERHDHGDFDPHFWLDPHRMIDAGELVLEQLVAMYPEQEEAFNQNFKDYKAKMNDLDEQYQTGLDEEINILVTHKSFSYIEQRYSIKQYSVRGISSSQEPSQKELQQLFEQIKDLQIEHIILETNSDDRLAQTIAEELDLKQYKLSNLSTRTEQEAKEDQDYYDIMLNNLKVLKEINH